MTTKVEIKSVSIRNFRGIEKLDVDLKHLTNIKGANGVGKTTIGNAISWCFYGKDLNGDNLTDVRPMSKDNKPIDFVDIKVAVTLEVDGREILLVKTQKQQFDDGLSLVGNKTTFGCNYIDKTPTEYKRYISDHICDEKTFFFCTNASAFFKLPQKKRREVLTDMIDFDDLKILNREPKFDIIRDELLNGTFNEVLLTHQRKAKLLDSGLEGFRIAIDEQKHSKVDLDLAELELVRNEIKRKLDVLTTPDASATEYLELTEKLLKLKFQKNDLGRTAVESIKKQKQQFEEKMSEIEEQIVKATWDNRTIETEIKNAQNLIDKDNMLIKIKADEWKRVKELVFDDTSLVCSYCGQIYPEKKQVELKAKFEEQKAKDLEDITKAGNDLRAEIKALENQLERNNASLESGNKQIEELNKILDSYKSGLEKLSTSVDVTSTDEYIKLDAEIKSIEQRMSEIKPIDDEEKDNIVADLNKQLDEINIKIASAMRNDDIDRRISELQAEQRETAQKKANEEKIINLLNIFNSIKMKALTDAVNSEFKNVKWKLFEKQINGNYADVCKAIIGGVDYENGLNDSARLIANIEILSTFQRLKKVDLPIFLDRLEAITTLEVPKIDNQLICMTATKDEGLVIE